MSDFQDAIDARAKIRASISPEILSLLDKYGWHKAKHGKPTRRLLTSSEKQDRIRLEMLRAGELNA